MSPRERKGIVIGAKVVGRRPRYQRTIEPFPEELVGREGVVVPDGTQGHFAIDEQHVQVMFKGLDHPVSCGRWELDALPSQEVVT